MYYETQGKSTKNEKQTNTLILAQLGRYGSDNNVI